MKKLIIAIVISIIFYLSFCSSLSSSSSSPQSLLPLKPDISITLIVVFTYNITTEITITFDFLEIN